MARTCPECRRRCIPPAQLDDVVMGQQRLGVNPESSSGQALISLIAMLREDARLPIGTIQRYLRTVHELHVSMGAIVDAVHRTARKTQGVVAGILERIRGSPVVHADETGWREDRHNGYVWTLSTPPCGTSPVQARGRICCGTATTCAPSTQMMRHWRGGLTPSTGSIPGPKPSPIPRPGGATAQLALEKRLRPSASPSWMIRRRLSPSRADAWGATSRACPVLDTGNSSSSWPNPKSRRTTTPPSAACATWSSVARSAAAPGRKRAPTAR